MANESQEQINQRLTQGVAANTAAIAAVAAERLVTDYKGVKATVASLPASGNKKGDLWYVTANGHGYFWSGVAWEDAGEITKGADGVDGTSPAVTITATESGHTVKITDATHPSGQTFNVNDGADGDNGADGYAPVVSVSKSGKVTTVTITDATHQQSPHTATINDGNDGTNGTNGQDGEDATYSLETKTVASNAVTLTNQAMNLVSVSGSTLTVNLPAKASGNTRLRDMAMKITAGSSACVVSVARNIGGVSITLDSDDSSVLTTAVSQNSTSLFLFSETANNRFTIRRIDELVALS